MVSYSGGKDSLATLLLVLEAGIRPKLLFLDTGLEFPEPIENVRRTAQRHDLELICEEAGSAFWDNLDHFGPPGKDFRWCCKTCKLGPATRAIEENFEGEVLSFIGQRANESKQRAGKGRVWRNPWVPRQLGASPIQKWNALDVWLYIFREGAEYNPIYEAGADRIGCWLCPASDMAEYETLCSRHPDIGRWTDFLRRHARERNYPEDWVNFNLWRWRRPPAHLDEMRKEFGLDLDPAAGEIGRAGKDGDPGSSKRDTGEQRETKGSLEFYAAGGHHPCTHGVSIEGAFSRPLDMESVAELLNIYGEPAYDRHKGNAVIGHLVTVFGDGAVVVKAKDIDTAQDDMARIREIVVRSELCVGCGVCMGRCPNDALYLAAVDKNGGENTDSGEHAGSGEYAASERKRIRIRTDKCVHCGKCLGPCPVIDFG